MFVLNLESNTLPVTHFTLPRWKRNLQRERSFLWKKISKQLESLELCIFQADKGNGLVIVHKSDLNQLYRNYLADNAMVFPPFKYFNDIQALRSLLADREPNLKATADDRPPTFYFKLKTHKKAFNVQEMYSPGLFEIRNSLTELSLLLRPIVYHKPSITTLVSSHLRPLLRQVIDNSPWLCTDIHEVMATLSHPSINLDTLYTTDIKSFYPSTPHDLILNTFDHYY